MDLNIYDMITQAFYFRWMRGQIVSSQSEEATCNLVSGVSHINNLPIEVLANIFRMLAEPSSSFPPSLEPSATPLAWIRVTQVCRHWRTTAYVFPDLWATLDAGQPDLFRVCLARAKAVPLRMIMRDRVCNDRVVATLEHHQLRDMIAACCGQIEELHVAPKFNYGPDLLKSLDSAAPRMRALTIESANLAFHGQLPQLFAGITPKLEELTLRGFTAWPGNKFENLTRLCLHDQVKHALPTLARFLDYLAASPRLEELALINAGPMHVISLDRQPLRLVSLPALRKLDIGYWPLRQIIALFLDHLVLPSSTAMNIWVSPCSLMESSVKLNGLLPDHLGRLAPFHKLKEICIITHSRVQYSKCTGGVSKTGEVKPDVLSIHNGILQFFGNFTDSFSLRILLDRFDMREVRSFTMALEDSEHMLPMPPISTRDWNSIFVRSPCLKNLTVISKGAGALLSLLFPASRDRMQVCLNLKRLTVPYNQAWSAVLLALLTSQRAARGRRLAELCALDACAEPKGTLDRYAEAKLKSCVAKVEYREKNMETWVMEPQVWPSAAYLWAESREKKLN